MNLRQAIKLAAKSIGNRKGRTFLTMLGIIIGLAAVITLVTYASGTTRQMMSLYESMGNNQITVSAYKYTPGRGNDSTEVFDKLYNYCLQLNDLVTGITPNQQSWGATIKYGAKTSTTMENQPSIYMGSNQWAECNNAKIASGRDISYLDVQSLNQVCVLSPLAKQAFFNYADPIGQQITIDGVPLTVVGVYAARITGNDEQSKQYAQWMDNYIVLPYTLTRTFTAAGSYNFNGGSNEFIVKAKDASSTTEAVTRLDGFLKGLIGDQRSGNSRGHYYVNSSNESIDYANEAAKSQQMLLGGIAAISLLVGGIGIMNIMLVTVTERTREIGIRKAIGAERKSIIIQFLIEACMICGIGGILGILVGYAATLILCKLALGMILLPSVGITAAAFIISVVLGIIFGLYPAIKASGLQPVEALRAE